MRRIIIAKDDEKTLIFNSEPELRSWANDKIKEIEEDDNYSSVYYILYGRRNEKEWLVFNGYKREETLCKSSQENKKLLSYDISYAYTNGIFLEEYDE